MRGGNNAGESWRRNRVEDEGKNIATVCIALNADK